jgi:hypothetical protein
VRDAKKAPLDAGDVWTGPPICADTKLLCSFYVGDRTYASAGPFIDDLAGRLANRVQLTSDAHRSYLTAVRETFGHSIDYGQLQKIYGADPAGEKRSCPAQCIGADRRVMMVIPMRSTSAHRMWSARTSPCGCICGASRASPMRSQRRSRTMPARSRELVVASCHTPTVLNPVEESLDQVASPGKIRAEA